MPFWELFTALASAASIVSFAIAISSVFNGRATRRVVRGMSSDTQALIREMQSEMRALFERMDQRADERHREVIQAIQTLRA